MIPHRTPVIIDPASRPRRAPSVAVERFGVPIVGSRMAAVLEFAIRAPYHNTQFVLCYPVLCIPICSDVDEASVKED